ncbi:MAG: bifunctional 5,10-methylene-tetrahydrofolate dehydrogenase/5,10-methylene-tetrahydrofolate cyclohydrolase [Puniceicoccales bacterium]|jgi:methylenetetrahydrofolate dehydrogenase (NADP+)/methenyltetrahydrofolate cyclohydrolase|nr:bifunctional 5,10-methylene-tetrahydrofolate dehydrogenase/5,10-methylene-tetrahydrofolate cyclohydrolase [Puniceicoccales bacterium]
MPPDTVQNSTSVPSKKGSPAQKNTMATIDGNAIARQIIQEVREKVASLAPLVPHVVFIRIGEDPASISYVSKKQKTAAEVGIKSTLEVFPPSISREELLARIGTLNADPSVHGILVQAPLPPQLNATEVFNHIRPQKDVDGFTSTSLGCLAQELPNAFPACTPAGIVELLKRTGTPIAGKHAVVVGRSLIVGKPVALLLLAKGNDATVTLCHSRTRNLADLTRQADILIAATGKPNLITANMVKEGAVVIDVGVNRVPDATKKNGYRLVGDVDFENVAPKTALITPVPGGVGPMTVAMLMRNTLAAALASPL